MVYVLWKSRLDRKVYREKFESLTRALFAAQEIMNSKIAIAAIITQ